MSDRPAIRAIVFDLGRVIIDVDTSETPRRWARVLGGGSEEVEEAYWGDTLHRRLERGQITIRQYHQHMLARLGREMSFEDFLEGWNAMLGAVLPKMAGLLKDLQGSVRLVCLTNTDPAHAQKWRESAREVMACFERVFVSYEMGARKPEVECYRQVLDFLGLPPGEVLLVDDKEGNVEAAKRMGMRGIVTTCPADTIAQLRGLGLPAERQ